VERLLEIDFGKKSPNLDKIDHLATLVEIPWESKRDHVGEFLKNYPKKFKFSLKECNFANSTKIASNWPLVWTAIRAYTTAR
jgi:hypothetical protein